jgi:hypothetical protein
LNVRRIEAKAGREAYMVSKLAPTRQASRFPKVLDSIAPLALLAGLVWIAHFWSLRSFGLYEDDYYSIPEAMNTKLGPLLHELASRTSFSDQGRPLHGPLISALSALGFSLGRLEGIYVIGYLIVVSNTLLFYLLLKRLAPQREVALLGGLAFCLFPADTTQAFLTHSLGLQPSLMLLLIAFHLYLSGKIKSSYVAAFCTLFIYETTFPVFLAAPLLAEFGNTSRKRTLLRHLLILGGLLLIVAVLRRAGGEERVVHFGALQGALLLANPLVGPVTTLAMFIYRPIEALGKLSMKEITPMSLAFPAIAVVLFRLRSYGQQEEDGRMDQTGLARWAPKFLRHSRGLFMVGLGMLILAYPLTLTTLGFAVSGRGTRAHMAGVVGASMMFASVGSAILRFAHSRNRKYIACGALSAWLALLAGFGLNVQHDYTAAWRFQRYFWTDVVRLCPDLTDGTVIFVDPSGLPDNRQFLFLRKQLEGVPDTKQIKFLTYTDLVLAQIYRFPASWSRPPIVFRLPIDWKSVQSVDAVTSDNEDSAEGLRRTLRTIENGNAILLETHNGRMTRRSGTMAIAGRTVTLKEESLSPAGAFDRSALYRYMIWNGETEEDRYLY